MDNKLAATKDSSRGPAAFDKPASIMSSVTILPSLNCRIIEASTEAEFLQVLNQTTSGEALADPKVKKNLSILLDAAHEARAHLFLVKFDDSPWCVVAESLRVVEEHIDSLRAIDHFQANIKPDSLCGMCIYAHEYALKAKLSDGILSASRGLCGSSIYPITGIHQIGFINVRSAKTNVYFDLTSKRYVFTPSGGNAAGAVCSGVIAIDRLGSTRVLESLYKTKWQVRQLKPNSLSALDDYKARFKKG